MKSFVKFFESNYSYQGNPFDELNSDVLVFFDTETTGINPSESQITEIAAIAIDSDTMKQLDQFHLHAKLTIQTLARIEHEAIHPEDVKFGKTIKEILQMTNYYNNKAEVTESEMIEKFVDWLPKNCIVIAHNAKFDLKMLNTRAKINGVKPATNFNKVLDTMQMSREFFIPASQELEKSNPEAKAMLDLLTKKFTKSGKRARVSSVLKDLIDAMDEKLDNWHEAMADVEATVKLFTRFKEFFSKYHGTGLEKSSDFRRRFSRAYKSRFRESVNENFKDGKKKGKSRPGRVKKAGASCNGSVTELRKRAKNSSGEKKKMYHWCANMKSGKKK